MQLNNLGTLVCSQDLNVPRIFMQKLGLVKTARQVQMASHSWQFILVLDSANLTTLKSSTNLHGFLHELIRRRCTQNVRVEKGEIQSRFLLFPRREERKVFGQSVSAINKVYQIVIWRTQWRTVNAWWTNQSSVFTGLLTNRCAENFTLRLVRSDFYWDFWLK